MPQPLSKVKPNADVRVGSHHLPPELTVLVVRTITAWAYNDHLLAKILTGIVKGEFETVSAMYQALSGGEAKRAAFMAAVRAAKPDDADLTQAVLMSMKASRNQRHSFAHHLICVADEIPESLILVDPSHLIEPDVAMRKMIASGEWQPKLTRVGNAMKFEAPPVPMPDKNRMFVYTKRDLESAAKDASECTEVIKALSGVLCSDPPDDQARQMLLNEPLIERALQRLTNGNAR